MSDNLAELLATMARLRNKENGCPWDLKQDFKSIAPHTIEEAYEVADAIDRGNMDDLKDELGDLLLQVIFHAQMASEENLFSFDDIVVHLKNKLIRRHPHIFGDQSAATAEDVKNVWDNVKKQEKAAKTDNDDAPSSILDGITPNLPIMLRTWKAAHKAMKAGFDWDDVRDICTHLNDEVRELVEEIDKDPQDNTLIKGELGDVLFTSLAICAKFDFNPEEVLRLNLAKFERRFRHMEQAMRDNGFEIKNLDTDSREEYWQNAKKAVG